MKGFARGIALMAAAALAACAPGMQGGAPMLLAGSQWRLTELNGQEPVAAADDAMPTLRFDASEPRASGSGGCNQFSGPYTQNGESLHFGPIVSTRRACADPAATRQETLYLEALHSTTRISHAAGILVLYAGDRAVARFQSTGK